ncbi:MAG: carbonic anhydrase [Planctomycetes bacterium]|nr:carbonic anhydrase [Planctomycetota bacterium]
MAPELDSGEALRRLRQGNDRFAAGCAEHPHLSLDHLRAVAEAGQHPFAAVVGCSDSRCPIELVFDAGVGDVFVIRVAGNFCSGDEIASVEYAAVHLEVPLVVVLGHTGCGAVTAAVAGEEAEGRIPQLLGEIEPAVRKARSLYPAAAPGELVDAAARENVWHAIENLFCESRPIAARVREGRTQVHGAFLELATGRVEWLGEHPQQAALMMR